MKKTSLTGKKQFLSKPNARRFLKPKGGEMPKSSRKTYFQVNAEKGAQVPGPGQYRYSDANR